MYLLGASGHAKVIIEILEACDIAVSGLFDDNQAIRDLLGYKFLGSFTGSPLDEPMIISIGNNMIRHRLANQYPVKYGQAIEPSAKISTRASIGCGTVIMRNVSINSDTRIGSHVIINTSATVDHDCVIEDFVHISPNATLCGGVTIGEGTHVGAAAIVTPCIHIGKWSVIGAGAVVISDIPDYATVVGNPAKIIRIQNPFTKE